MKLAPNDMTRVTCTFTNTSESEVIHARPVGEVWIRSIRDRELRAQACRSDWQDAPMRCGDYSLIPSWYKAFWICEYMNGTLANCCALKVTGPSCGVKAVLEVIAMTLP